MKVLLHNGSEVCASDVELGSGSMGSVHATDDGKGVVKLFHRPTKDLEASMDLILERYNCSVDRMHPERNSYWSALYAWPTAIVTHPRLGLIIPRYPAECKNLIELFGGKNYRDLPEAEQRWNVRVLIAWRLAQGVARLHLMGLAHSDLSHNNVRANFATGQVRIIDLDGLVVPDHKPPDVLGTRGYMAPEVLAGRAMPSIATDKHALAVLLYRLLLFRHPLEGKHNFGLDPDEDGEAIEAAALGEGGIYIDHPTDQRNRPKNMYSASMLGPTLTRLFEQAFVQGLRSPGDRPRADEWKTALGRLLDRLVPCADASCAEHYYPLAEGRASRCPWCDSSLAIRGGIPVLRLYEPGPKQPAPITDFWIAGYHGRTLHVWHSAKGAEPDPFSDQDPIGRIENGKSGWSLTNIKCAGLAKLDSVGKSIRSIPLGQSVELREGTILRLGDPPSARLVLVQWVN